MHRKKYFSLTLAILFFNLLIPSQSFAAESANFGEVIDAWFGVLVSARTKII